MAKQLNIPNGISFLRLLTIPPIFLLILNSTAKNYPILVTLFVVSYLLDFMDGYLARKLQQETELGKILDPIADKLTVFFVVLGLMIKSDFPVWLGIIILSRDAIILSASLVLMKKKKQVAPSNLVGKCTFAALGLLVLAYILDLHPAISLPYMKGYFVAQAIAFLGWSLLEYYGIYKEEKNGAKKPKTHPDYR